MQQDCLLSVSFCLLLSSFRQYPLFFCQKNPWWFRSRRYSRLETQDQTERTEQSYLPFQLFCVSSVLNSHISFLCVASSFIPCCLFWGRCSVSFGNVKQTVLTKEEEEDAENRTRMNLACFSTPLCPFGRARKMAWLDMAWGREADPKKKNA